MRAVFCVRPRHQLVLALLCSLPTAASLGAGKTAEPAPPLEVRDFDLAANQDQPVLCFTLSQTVARRPDLPLESFIESEPAAQLSAVPRNNRLCLTGFTFGNGYTVTLKSGLPGVSSTLGKDTQFRIQVPNRPPEFDFAAVGGDVLPRLGNDGLPVRSVNVPKIDIDLFRIDDADIAVAQTRPPLNGTDIETFAPSRGERVWHGTIEPKAEVNRDAVTFVPVQQAIGTLKPGLYVAAARQTGANADPKAAVPTQYFLISDLGLAAYRGVDSLTVWVRSLSTANAATGTDIALIGRNNRELARSHADDNGFVRFDGDVLHGAGGSAPAAVYGYAQSGDFALLNLAADLDKAPQGTAQVLFFPDRAGYQPGETANLLALLRADTGGAIPKLPLTVTIVRPDGAIFDTRTVTDAGGGYDIRVAIPATGATGTWRVEAALADDPQTAGHIAFDVGPNPPDRLSAGVSADTAALDPTQQTNLTVQAQYADGAAAPATPGNLQVTVGAAATPFPAFPDFSFGLVDEALAPDAAEAMRFTTDATGKASLPAKFAVPPLATKPQEATVTARLFDAGGRATEYATNIPVATQNLILGIRPTPGPVFADQTAHFEVIAVSPDGARQEKPGAGWEILRQESAPSWDWDGTRFVYRPIVRYLHISGGMLDIPATAPAALETKLPPGRYRIEIFDPAGEAISSAHFMVGWAAASLGVAPDAIDIKPAKPTYHAGENAEIFVKPPYEADVALIPADPRIRGATVQHVPAAGATMHIDIPPDAGAGIRLMATAVAPADPATPNLARRAFAQIPLVADPADRELEIKLSLPAIAAPQSVLAIPVTVAGAGDEAVFVRVVATDAGDGEADTPDAASPLAALIEKNAEAIDAIDNYGKIITASGLSNGVLRMPAGEKPVLRNPFDPSRVSRAPVALSSGIVALDKAGLGKVSLTIPDYAGKLRIVAIAWSASRIGQSSATLPVNYPLSVAVTLPPRLAPDDRADLTLALDNIDGPRGEYHIKPHAEGGLVLQDESELTANLAEHEQRSLSISILAKDAKAGVVTLSVTGPNGIAFDRRLAVDVGAGVAPLARYAQLSLKPGNGLAADPGLGGGLRPESIRTFFTVGAGTDFELNGLADALGQAGANSADWIVGSGSIYLTSADVLRNLGRSDDGAGHLARAARALAGFQSPDGGFGRWIGSVGDPWLSALAVDFLTRCKAAGVTVPDATMDQALSYLARHVAQVTGGPPDQGKTSPAALAEAAYGAKVLAANGRYGLLQLRYFNDRFQPIIREPVAASLIAATFAELGDKAAATAGFARAMAVPGDTGALGTRASDMDSQAILTALMIESGAVAQPLIASALAKLSAVTGDHRQFTTSEATWLFRVAATLSASEGTVKIKIGDSEHAGDHALWASTIGLPTVKNLGDKPLRMSMTITGVPAPGEVKDQGFELQRWLFDTSGKPVDPANIHQNDMLLVVLTGRFTGQGEAHPVIVDPLPAGWEIEAAEIADPDSRYPWLKDLTGTSHVQADDGRYVAVPNMTGERHDFKLAYVVRAAIRGQFSLPGATIQDVAQPSQWGRSAAGRTKIDPAP